MQDKIIVKGARANNLKNIDVTIPRDKLVVMTGLSGSGKSSLAFDTIYAEGQRRYVESLSSYARMFLGQMDKPDVDYIEGLSPAISIDQKTTSKNPRSTVGTVTEIYDYLRLLWARVGTPHCPKCGKVIRQQTIDQIIDQVMALPEGTRIQVMAPVIRGKKGEHAKVFDDAKRSGYVRVRVDGNLYELDEEIKLEKNKKHSIEVIVDRLIIRPDIQQRLTDSVETASALSGGLVVVNLLREDRDLMFSQNYACEDCGISMEELTPRMFSFNNPFGACPTCTGLGSQLKVDPALVVPDEKLSILDGAIQASGWGNIRSDGIARMYFEALSKKYHFSLTTPWQELSQEVRQVILYGTGGEKLELHYDQPRGKGVLYQAFEGVCNNVERRYRETQSDASKRELEELMAQSPCPDCRGRRLKKESLAVTVGDLDIYQYTTMSVDEELAWVDQLELTEQQLRIAGRILKEIRARLGFLQSVGLGYLTLSRSAATLSGGESQRIRLATQIGSSLMGVLYILDEPSIGLHQRDNDKLLATLQSLRDLGNTLLVVEHDEDTMRAADYLIDIGPGAGIHGGEVVAAGTPEEVMANPNSLTGQYLSGKKKIPVPAQRRSGNGKVLKVIGAAENNLRGIDVTFPLGTLTVVTGVSGSGKSSLVNEVLFKRLGAELMRMKVHPGKCERIEGIDQLDKVVDIDQSPIGRTPRSNPATYTGLFNDIRDLFASTQEAKSRGYGPGRFSFNVRGGRCEACSGDGVLKIEMHFLPDIFVPCEVCKGRRYNRETLEVRYKGKNISEVLDMTVDEAVEFFAALPRLSKKLKTLQDVGLGYVKLGQPSTELSGGEAQRVKLATELSKQATGKTIYILDEPTTGLHADDVRKLLEVLQRLVDTGNTVVVIEHNLDVIKCADHLIDLGPEGGDGGGTVVVTGTPEEVAACEKSYTGQYLKKVLAR
ncbi:MAG: excinuclease ABC subunit UvrA [Dysosmobacter sp.]|jgi:excinuclease ABC subunit A|uniref:excinuclease ABC subunit UvrA n=1 Tax=Dysosmobacter sp. TaxID=2591382 RepID=UPI003D8E83C6